jgi:hypothetical protein
VAKGDENITPFGFSVLPSTIAAGGQITLRVDRDSGGCRGAVMVRSGIFDTVFIHSSRTSASTTVDWEARAGVTYRVTFTCDGVSGSTDLTIAEHRPVGHRPHPLRPPGPVQAGEGGSIAGFDLKEIGLGLALIAGSVGTAYHFSRRRTGEDGA